MSLPVLESAVQPQKGIRRRKVMLALARNSYLYAMFALPALYFIVFHYVPMFGNLIAFEDYNVVQGFFHSDWVGLKFFREFMTDPYFWKLVRNTLLLSVYTILFSFPAPVIFALLLNELRLSLFKRFVQSVTYLPHFLSTVVVAGMLVNFLSIDGLFNQLIQFFGGQKIQFLNEAGWFRTIYVGSEIWQGTGWGTIIYLAALTAIDPQLYEAARMDGAGRLRQMWSVTLPGMAPVIIILLLLNLGHIMSVGFEKILLLYTGSTYETADVIQTYVYRRGLLDADLSYATAVSIFQSVLAFVLVVLANQVARKVSDTSLW
ncbi:ABC transporter permease [Paenibacillus humicola]|uniref:ABC transporter permease n=1 Tax=Paenibacillus humicola TaxID=3110540 RepID=UPI00237A2835|nr:ABC transporter permease subunit [Paenibacillus humicola]